MADKTTESNNHNTNASTERVQEPWHNHYSEKYYHTVLSHAPPSCSLQQTVVLGNTPDTTATSTTMLSHAHPYCQPQQLVVLDNVTKNKNINNLHRLRAP